MLQAASDFTPAPITAFEQDGPVADYDRVRRALAFITARWRDQPSQDEIAAHVGLSPSHLHHVFPPLGGADAEGVPTGHHARPCAQPAARFGQRADTSFEVGLSGPGRLHDLFVTHEAMSPGEWKAAGAGLV